MDIGQKDYRIINAQDDDTLAAWYVLLNNWGWPEKLPDPEPRLTYTRGSRRYLLIQHIFKKIGKRACVRAHHPEMNDTDFNLWYDQMFVDNLCNVGKVNAKDTSPPVAVAESVDAPAKPKRKRKPRKAKQSN